MKILAIDPGNIFSAYCVINSEYEIIEKGKVPNESLSIWLRHRDQLPFTLDKVIIEMIGFMGMGVGKDVFETCVWIGRFIECAETLPVEYIYRRQEKIVLCGTMKAKDTNIRAALIKRFAKFDFKNGKGTKDNPDFFYGVKADIWSAFAVGVTYLDLAKQVKKP